MAIRQAVYLVIKGTGLKDENGVEQVIVLEAKLTRASAEAACLRHEGAKIIKMIAVVSISIVAVLVSYAFLLPLIFNQLLGLGLAIRLLATVVLLTPLGFLMGFPFPLGLRLLKEMRVENYIPVMWCINGSTSWLVAAVAWV